MDERNGYRTVLKAGQDEFYEKKSRFIGYIAPVSAESEALAFIAQKKKLHWDATHNVWAYILRQGNTVRYSDDGEPQGTAGVPVLNVLQKRELSDVVCVVTRYFGGILLGAGGLVRAYSHGAATAVQSAGVGMVRLCSVMSARCPYALYEGLKGELEELGAVMRNEMFEQEVTLTFYTPCENEEPLRARVTDFTRGRVACVTLGSEYRVIDEKNSE